MKQVIKKIFPLLFLVLEGYLYRQLLNGFGDVFTYSAYGSILLCFFFALCHIRTGSWRFIAALACTVGADYFLVIVSPQDQFSGMVFFLFAQMFYAWQLHSTCKKKWPLYLRLALNAGAILIAFIVLGENADPLALISMCYYANLVMNIVVAFLQFSRYRLAAIGFIFFLLCDTVIGLQVASTGYLPIEPGTWLYDLIHPNFNLSWFFYLPSQVLLALSSRKK